MNAFLAMGGYAVYVWPAFAVFFIVLLADYLISGIRSRRTLREIRARQKRQHARRGS